MNFLDFFIQHFGPAAEPQLQTLLRVMPVEAGATLQDDRGRGEDQEGERTDLSEEGEEDLDLFVGGFYNGNSLFGLPHPSRWQGLFRQAVRMGQLRLGHPPPGSILVMIAVENNRVELGLMGPAGTFTAPGMDAWEEPLANPGAALWFPGEFTGASPERPSESADERAQVPLPLADPGYVGSASPIRSGADPTDDVGFVADGRAG